MGEVVVPQKHNRRWLWISLLVAFLVMNIVLGIYNVVAANKPFPITIRHRDIVAPLEFDDKGVTFPTIHITDPSVWPTVRLDSETCSTGDVTVNADLVWSNLQPSGFADPRGSLLTQLDKGCHSTSSELQILDATRQRIKDQAALGNVETVWKITGAVATLNNGENTGKIITWDSNTFVIRYDLPIQS